MDGNTFDLAAFDTRKGGEAGFDLQLKSPGSGRLLPLWVRVRGYDSDSYQNLLETQQRRRIEKLPRVKPTVEELKADSQELSGTLVAGWWVAEKAGGEKKPLKMDGQPFDFSPENAARFMQRFPDFREQIEAAAVERANFLPGSASS